MPSGHYDGMPSTPARCPKCGSAHVDVVSRRSPLGDRYEVAACRWCTYEEPLGVTRDLSGLSSMTARPQGGLGGAAGRTR